MNKRDWGVISIVILCTVFGCLFALMSTQEVSGKNTFEVESVFTENIRGEERARLEGNGIFYVIKSRDLQKYLSKHVGHICDVSHEGFTITKAYCHPLSRNITD